MGISGLKKQFQQKYKQVKTKQNQTYKEKIKLMEKKNNLNISEMKKIFWKKQEELEEQFHEKIQELEKIVLEKENQIKELNFEFDQCKKSNKILEQNIGSLNYEKQILNENIKTLENQHNKNSKSKILQDKSSSTENISKNKTKKSEKVISNATIPEISEQKSTFSLVKNEVDKSAMSKKKHEDKITNEQLELINNLNYFIKIEEAQLSEK